MSSASTATRLGRELSAICGAEHVIEDPRERIGGAAPAIVVSPASADEVAAVLRVANEHGLSVVPAGGFTQQNAGNAPGDVDVLLYTTRLTDVEHYDSGDLTIGVGAGWTVSRLSAKLAADNLFFAGDPALPDRCTIGGLLATGSNGPHRHGYGGLRDYCIGVRFVTGDGRKAKGGGRVVKNVAGYDLVKLLIGSWGTLGIITSVSFKLFPAPRQTRTYLAEFATAAEAIGFRNHILCSPLSPSCLELVSPQARRMMRPEMADSKTWVMCVRAAGSDAVLARYRTELGSAVTREMEGEGEAGMWRSIANFPITADSGRDETFEHPLSLGLPLRDVGPMIESLQQMANNSGIEIAVIGRVGVGHLTAVSLHAGDGSSFAAFVEQVRKRLPRDASLSWKTPWEVTPSHMESMRAVKKALDPNDILNRGRFPL